MDDPKLTIEQFIRSHLQTVDQLRAFLLLAGSGAEGLVALDAASRLYIPQQSAADALARLEACGLASSGGDPPRYRFDPRSPELARLANEAILLDRERPVTLLNAIYARPTGIQAFADAFRLRKERNE